MACYMKRIKIKKMQSGHHASHYMFISVIKAAMTVSLIAIKLFFLLYLYYFLHIIFVWKYLICTNVTDDFGFTALIDNLNAMHN